jgi:hypothetical protein
MKSYKYLLIYLVVSFAINSFGQADLVPGYVLKSKQIRFLVILNTGVMVITVPIVYLRKHCKLVLSNIIQVKYMDTE